MLEKLLRMIETWGREPEVFVDLFCPSMNNEPAFVRWAGRFERLTASPADIMRQLESVLELDATDRLAGIKAPTLVMNVVGDRIIPPASGRFLADKIPQARYVEFQGEDHFFFVNRNWRLLMDCWVEFVTGVAPTATKERRFATVLFTDIVDSTARAAEVGDQAWRATLEQHDEIAWKMVDRYSGNLVKNTGDGLLLTFNSLSDGIACAAALQRELSDQGLTIRAGLHAGEVEVRQDGDVTGFCVNLAARVQAAASDGATFVSSTMRDLLMGGTATFEDRGEHTLKGFDGAWRLYQLAS